MKLRNKEEIMQEILRVREALKATTSRKLNHDYTKYLNRLERELKEYDGTFYIECCNKKKFSKC